MRVPQKALFVALILLATVLQIPLTIGDPGWLSGWDYRVKITIDSGDIDEVLTDFPILIYISDLSGINGENASFVFDEVGANSLKIAVTLSDGTTECYVEVEKWDLGNRQAWLWSKIASISNIADTEIYLYYDKDHADNTNKVGPTNSIPAENVWDNDYSAVYHMADGVDNAHVYDSTEDDVDGTKIGANEPTEDVNGQIGNCMDYDGSDDQITLQDTPFDYVAAFTFEFWMKTTDTTADGRIVFKNTGIPNRAYFVQLSRGSIGLFACQDGTNFQYDYSVSNDYNSGNWVHVGVVYDAGTVYWYKNGIADGSDPTYNTLNTNAEILLLVSTNSPIDLDLDEFRASGIVRSSSYFKATYKTGIDDLLDFGPEETEAIETPAKLFGAGFNSSSPVVDLYWKTNLTGITLFEVQNSTDKVSWAYLGSNTTAEYHDFQVVNGTERYYRVRACNFTGGAWINSTFTDVNFETVYFVEAAGIVEEGDTIIMGASGVFWIIGIILVPIVAYMVKRR